MKLSKIPQMEEIKEASNIHKQKTHVRSKTKSIAISNGIVQADAKVDT